MMVIMWPSQVYEKCLEEQAKRMKKTSDQIHSPVGKGISVRIRVPDVDRGRGDALSILEVVDDVFYRIGTRNGILKQLFSRSQLSKCPRNIIQEKEDPLDERI